MRRTIVIVLLGSLTLTAARSASAQSDPSCETVTTVRCTGSAAPLALPGNAAASIAVAPQLVQPPSVAPIAVPPAPQALPRQEDDSEVPVAPRFREQLCCAAPMPLLNPLVFPGGWKLIEERGELMLERKKRTGIGGVWGPGLALWMLSYVGTAVGGTLDKRPWAAVPFFGGFIAGGIDLMDGKLGRGFGYAAGSILQLSGFITFLVGVGIGEKIERMPLRIAPTASRDGGGLSLSARF